jgi:putative RecB family exonuclease
MTQESLAGPGARGDAPPDRSYFSYSALSLFRSCPLRYFFKYVARVPESSVSASLVLGAAMHASLECHFRALRAGSSPPDLDALLQAFWSGWHAHDDRTIQFARDDDLRTIERLAARMLRAFQRSEVAIPAGTILAVGQEFRGRVIPGLPELLARVDLLVDVGDAVVLTDFKTARGSWNEDNLAEAEGQLLLYHELVREMAAGKPVRLFFAVLTKTKFPVLTLHPVPADPVSVDRNKRAVERVWQAIQAGHVYPNPSPLHCSSCPYREQCRRWRG